MNQRQQFEQKTERACASMMRTLVECGLDADFKDLLVFKAFEHGMQHQGDVTNVLYGGKHGYLLRTGVHIPTGQNSERPEEVEVFCGIEEPQISQPPYADGFRLSHRVAAGSWYIRSWAAVGEIPDIGNIRRDILGVVDRHTTTIAVPRDKALHILTRIAQLYMKGA